jgi:glycosyltransferase involved in cell wall biosynthesis
MMKICLIDPSLFTWFYDVRLARALSDNGHQAMIFGRAPSAPLPADEAAFLSRHFYPGLETPWLRRLPHSLYLLLKGASHLESMARLVWRLRRWRPDVIHVQWAPLAVVDRRFVPVLRRIAPTVLTVHDSAPFNNDPRARLQRLGAIDIMRRFDRLIVHTASARARVESYGIPAERVELIPLGPLLEIRRSSSCSAAAAGHDDRVRLLLFGQIKPYKGIDILLKAVGTLPAALRSRCHVRIVGRPQMAMEPLLSLAAELGIAGQVEFDLRYVADAEIPGLLLSADILMFPYREIDASGVLMLALAAGRPIVASNIGLFAELLVDGRHGALVEPGNPSALAAALMPLISDPAKRLAIGSEVEALHQRIPAWSEIARRTAAIYQDLIDRRRKAGARLS